MYRGDELLKKRRTTHAHTYALRTGPRNNYLIREHVLKYMEHLSHSLIDTKLLLNLLSLLTKILKEGHYCLFSLRAYHRNVWAHFPMTSLFFSVSYFSIFIHLATIEADLLHKNLTPTYSSWFRDEDRTQIGPQCHFPEVWGCRLKKKSSRWSHIC